MQIAIVSNGAVTKVGEFRSLFPYTVFPESGPTDRWLADNSCKKVNLFKPHDSATKMLVPSSPYVEGDWVYTVTVRAKTPEETAADVAAKAASMRSARDRALAASDWRVVKAMELGQQLDADWAAYRQALRNLPEAEGWPNIKLPHDPDYVPMGLGLKND
jgi:hypothetical protein